MNSAIEKAKKRYSELFPDDGIKAKAFDALAERYYFANFGTMSKNDFEVLMFSLYLEQILDSSESDINTYSDYTMSKLLGITQNRISTLKEKKELQYPYDKFSWQKSFERIAGNYRYENGKIVINITDKNLYLELKNAIEERNGYIENTLSPTLLKIAPEYYIDLLLATTLEDDRQALIDKLKTELPKHEITSFDLENESVGEILKKSVPDAFVDITCDLLESCIPVVGTTIGKTLNKVVKSIKG